MSASAATSGASTGSTQTLEERLEERLAPINAILQNSTEATNERLWLSVQDQVNAIRKDLLDGYFAEKPTHDPLNLTLGVEIEGGLLQDTKVDSRWTAYMDPATDEVVTAAQQAVFYALSQPCTKQCPDCEQAHTYQLRVNDLRGEGRGDTFDYNRWTVGTDKTVRAETMRLKFEDQITDAQEPDESKQFKFHGFEIRSRVMGHGKNILARATTSCERQPEVTYQDEIRAAYDLLIEAFLNPLRPAEDRAWRLMVNDSMDLHVHIGNDKERFPLRTVKNVISLCTANERQIDYMHARDHITGSTLNLDPRLNSQGPPGSGTTFPPQDRSLTRSSEVKDPYNRPFSAHYAFMAYANRAKDRAYRAQQTYPARQPYPNIEFINDDDLRADAKSINAGAWLRIVEKAERADYLNDLQARANHTATINLENMAPIELKNGGTAVAVEKSKNTIEFRQAAATLDPNAALAWVDFLVKLVEYSHDAQCDQVQQDCQTVWQDINHTTLDFLHTLGFRRRDSTFKHYQHVGPWCSPETTYSHTLLLSELNRANSFGDEDPMVEFMIFNSTELCKELNPDNVGARIQDKFTSLCYGQFEKSFVDFVAREQDWPLAGVKTAHQMRLTIGSGWSSVVNPHTEILHPFSDEDIEGRPDSEIDHMFDMHYDDVDDGRPAATTATTASQPPAPAPAPAADDQWYQWGDRDYNLFTMRACAYRRS